WYEGALDADPTSVNAWNNLGTTAETEGDSTRAIECYERALSIRPTAPDPRHNLAGIHFRLGVAALRAGSDSTAIRHLTRCLSLLPTAITHYDLAIALGRTGEPERALAHLDSALALDPLLAPARQLREQLRGQ
ncbi:tetratricopeptide repeat protein, partial [bacterium]|nr:tetratricopeptide repeat protein [bacterium]